MVFVVVKTVKTHVEFVEGMENRAQAVEIVWHAIFVSDVQLRQTRNACTRQPVQTALGIVLMRIIQKLKVISIALANVRLELTARVSVVAKPKRIFAAYVVNPITPVRQAPVLGMKSRINAEYVAVTDRNAPAVEIAMLVISVLAVCLQVQRVFFQPKIGTALGCAEIKTVKEFVVVVLNWTNVMFVEGMDPYAKVVPTSAHQIAKPLMVKPMVTAQLVAWMNLGVQIVTAKESIHVVLHAPILMARCIQAAKSVVVPINVCCQVDVIVLQNLVRV
jgi:hypothetical protein